MRGSTGLVILTSAACFLSAITAQATGPPECENATLGDIVFLIDGSTGISPVSFQEVRTFLRNIIKNLDIGSQKVRVGLAQHSDDVQKEFLLKDHMDQTSLLAAVERIPYRRGGAARPLTGNALDLIRDEMFTEEAGGRAGQRVPQIAVVITGGESSDEVVAPAQRLRQHGVVVFGVGVGEYSQTQLEAVANWPPERFLNTANNFRALRGLTDRLLTSLCVSMEEERKALANRFADIFFLVDNGLLPKQFKLFKNELVRLINQTDVQTSGYRIGLAQYGQGVKVDFDLTSYDTKRQTIKAVENVKQLVQTSQIRNLGNALKYGAQEFFSSEKGGRAHLGAEQFLVTVVGKKSDDRVVRPAQTVKSRGVTLVGASPTVPQAVLESFSSPGFTLNSLRVTQLKDALITKKVETVTEDCKGASVADVVFVVDESGSIKEDNFRLMRTFLHSVVSGLNVSQARVRVGIVTYNREPKAQAYLNTFNDKPGILQFIKTLPYRKGGTNTGAALNFTLDAIFQKDRGSRKGVQKVVIVMTDGKSEDSVKEASIALRRKGVTIYAVGIENANRAELEKMATEPASRHVFNVSSFDLLKPLKTILQRSICNSIIKTSVPKKDAKEACVQSDEADIYFLIDDSGSIEHLDFRDMTKFIIEILQIFRIGPHHVRIGLAKFSDSPTLEFDLTRYSNAKDMETAVKGIFHAGGGTKAGEALLFMGPLFKAAETRKVPKYLVVITDGESSDPVKAPAETLRSQGVTVFAIGVDKYNNSQLLEIAGDSRRTFHVSNYDALKTINDGILTEICATEVCKDVPSDIIFITDSSESISDEDFLKMKHFMKSVISKSPIGPDDVQVGVMQFSTNPKLEFDLTTYRRKEEVLRAIDDMDQLNEDSHPGKAMAEVSKYFDASRGGRPALRQVLVLITANQAKDAIKAPAEALRAKGVVIYAVGVMEANINQLVQISGSLEQTFNQENFDELQEIIGPLALKFCDPQRDCKKTTKADIIFLMDSSRSISASQFISMKVFMDSIVNLTTVGRELTRFGVILYSDTPESKFQLGDTESRQQVLGDIKSLVQVGVNTYTGSALEYSLQYFNDEHGGRRKRGVPQILMVITDGAATDPHKLKASSDALRGNAVNVFSIGVKNADKRQLLTMAGDDEAKVFYVDDFKGLETLSKQILPLICNTTKSSHCEKSDLVFLLDHSSSINEKNMTNHDTMKNFVADVVDKFDVSQEWIRVGLAQFANDPQDEFYLNKYDSKKDVTDYIRTLTYKGGDTYLGKALANIKKYFDPSRGGRSGIPKTLLVISDGDAHDDVEDVAYELRNMGIEIFAIGIGNIHILKLLQITGSPEKIFQVQDFDSLKNIKTKVYEELCKKPDDEPKDDCDIDVAVGFDISTTRTPRVSLTRYVTRLEEVLRSVYGITDTCCTAPLQTSMAFHVGPPKSPNFYETDFKAYEEDVMRDVLAMSWSQPTFFNSDMLQFFQDKFKSKSKAKVKVLLIFSDGLDERNVMKLEQESDLLLKSGVSALVTVALGGADPFQLQMVEFGRGFSHHLPISIGMHSLGGAVRQQIRAVANRICCNVSCECTGHEGGRGGPGTPGTKGPSGAKGQQGFSGDEGIPGERGPPGPGGLQGLQGCPGTRGLKGSRSFSGSRGEDGEDGVDGVNGEQGVTGRGGSQGEKGPPGKPGNTGTRGEAGLKGERGLRGDPGEPGLNNINPGRKGEPGNPGMPGPPGLNGEPGGAGGSGNRGPDGRRGPSGEPGVAGGRGARGLPGTPGASGPQGRRGEKGDRGPDGPPGFPGPQGSPGPVGPPGQAGSRGAVGQKGQPGDPGVKGATGIQGPRGIPGSDGRDGTGPDGPPGAKGDPGFPGYPGLPGESGLQGTGGDPGRKGNRGRGGNSGRPGDAGLPGNPGDPGHQGLPGPPGSREKTDCELITFIRDNCVCSHGASRCPAYPTELVFGLDQSSDVVSELFERQRRALLALLDDITVAESNCPTGARVAVVGYGEQTRSLIRFQDHRSRKQLAAAVQGLTFRRSREQRHLGAAMLSVGQNIFKRVRSGVRMRKVAIFFTNGPAQDTENIVGAMMVYRALNIVPVVVSLRSAPAIAKAMEVDDSGSSIFTVLGRPQTLAADLSKVRNCAICYDPCRRSGECPFIQEQQQPQQVELDLAMVLDGSREMKADEYAGAQRLLGSVVEQLAVSPQPQRARDRARVALVQQGAAQTARLEFGLQTYQNQELMRSHLIRKARQQSGPSALGRTLDYTLKEVLLKAGQPGRRKVLLTVLATQTASTDRARLRYVSQKAKCEGVALFVVTVGDRYNRTQAEELAGLPVQQHLIHLSRLTADEQGYAQRFFRVFLSALKSGLNTYPPPSMKQSCLQLRETDDVTDRQRSADVEEFAADEPQRDVVMETKQPDAINTLRGDDRSPVSPEDPEDVCLLSQQRGGCSRFRLMWFYESSSSRCSRFIYSGCGGNRNRFRSQEECEERCGGGEETLT